MNDPLTFKEKRILLLKTVFPFFEDVQSMKKGFEVRKNDRKYQVGDILMLAKFDLATGFTPNQYCVRQVKYILPGGQYGIDPDYCVLGLGIYYFDELYAEWYNLLIAKESSNGL